VKRGQWATDDRDSWLKLTAGMDGRRVPIQLNQDPGQAGKSQILSLTKMLAGYTVRSQIESGDKMTRADSFSSQVNVGNVWIVRGEWNRDYIEELRQFPKGKNDDAVDASSSGFNVLTSKRQALIA
jgi:predicted phage terminase large subunit-like protein